MGETNKFTIISIILTLFCVMPIWFYLLFKILVAIEASELIFFLFGFVSLINYNDKGEKKQKDRIGA